MNLIKLIAIIFKFKIEMKYIHCFVIAFFAITICFSQEISNLPTELEYVRSLINDIKKLENEKNKLKSNTNKKNKLVNQITEKYQVLKKKYNHSVQAIQKLQLELELTKVKTKKNSDNLQAKQHKIEHLTNNIKQYVQEIEQLENKAKSDLGSFKNLLDKMKNEAMQARKIYFEESVEVYFDGVPHHQAEIKNPKKVSFKLFYTPLLEADYPDVITANVSICEKNKKGKSSICEGWSVKMKKSFKGDGDYGVICYKNNEKKRYSIRGKLGSKKIKYIYIVTINDCMVISKPFFIY